MGRPLSCRRHPWLLLLGALIPACSTEGPGLAPLVGPPDGGAPFDAGPRGEAGGNATPDATAPRDGGADGEAGPDAAAPAPLVEPDAFGAGEVDVTTEIRVREGRRPISPLLYGINAIGAARDPAGGMSAITFVRRGGDRANAYNWETNVSNGTWDNGWSNDLYLAEGLADPNAPAAVDLALIGRNRAAGRASMVPFVLHGWVAGPVGGDIPFDDPDGWTRSDWFHRVELVKPTLFATTPDLADGRVYTDEHLDFLRARSGADIYAPGPSQVMIGIDNEPDLYAYNFPMLQEGSGDALHAENGVEVGRRVTGHEFTDRFLTFAKRARELAPSGAIVGPSHYHFDGWTSWHDSMPEYSSQGRWYMDDFLAKVRTESERMGKRLLDTWDFHWYPQHLERGRFVWELDESVRPLTAGEIQHVVQGPRSYWDPTWDEDSWITRDHLFGPTRIVTRLQERIAAAYPGTEIGVSEYFPGGCGHIASGVAVADTLGVFARLGVHLAAMWPACDRLEYALGALRLYRDADGAGLRFADTVVAVEHPESVESSVHAGSDGDDRVTVVVVNKTESARRIGLRLHAPRLSKVRTFRIDREHPSPHLAGSEALVKTNALRVVAPALSATLLVLEP